MTCKGGRDDVGVLTVKIFRICLSHLSAQIPLHAAEAH